MFEDKALVAETDKLRKFAIRLTRNGSDAQDLLQSTLVRALEKKALFEKGTNLFGWASKIMFNIFVTQYRRKARFETQYDPDNYLETEGVAANQETLMEWRNVQRAMERLSDDHREILVMICVEGMQYAEVSNVLKIPVGTVRSRLSRARESLQATLNAVAVKEVKDKGGFSPADSIHPAAMAA